MLRPYIANRYAITPHGNDSALTTQNSALKTPSFPHISLTLTSSW